MAYRPKREEIGDWRFLPARLQVVDRGAARIGRLLAAIS